MNTTLSIGLITVPSATKHTEKRVSYRIYIHDIIHEETKMTAFELTIAKVYVFVYVSQLDISVLIQ